MKQISKLRKNEYKNPKDKFKNGFRNRGYCTKCNHSWGNIKHNCNNNGGALRKKKKILAIGDGKENQINWKIIPLYQNRNLLNIDLNCIISFKLIHIINAI